MFEELLKNQDGLNKLAFESDYDDSPVTAEYFNDAFRVFLAKALQELAIAVETGSITPASLREESERVKNS